jgi:hypothetical protein
MSLGNRYRICGLLSLNVDSCACVSGPTKRESAQRRGLGWFWFSFSMNAKPRYDAGSGTGGMTDPATVFTAGPYGAIRSTPRSGQ